MMKVKTLITAGLIATFPTALLAATGYTKQQAQALVPFKQIEIIGRYANSIDAVQALMRKADKEGATGFYIASTSMYRNSDSLRVVKANLYKKDAATEPKLAPHFRSFGGVLEYTKQYALPLEPFDMIRLHGYFANQYNINEEVSKIAAEKEAYAFYIDQQIQYKGKNTEIVAYLFKKNAAHREIQPKNAIPYDSETARKANANEIEKPGYESPTEFDENYYAAKFSGKLPTMAMQSKPEQKRYTITLHDGQKIQELNNKTAGKMTPFSAIQFRGYFVSDVEISRQVAKRAARQGAKYYHITRILQETKGPNKTIFADLFC